MKGFIKFGFLAFCFISCQSNLRIQSSDSKEKVYLCPLQSPSKNRDEARAIRQMLANALLAEDLAVQVWEEEWGNCHRLKNEVRISGEFWEKEDYRTSDKHSFLSLWIQEGDKNQIQSFGWSKKDAFESREEWEELIQGLLRRYRKNRSGRS